MKQKHLGPILLFIAAIIWGSSFIFMKSAVDYLPPSTLLFIRFTLSSLVMFGVCFYYIKKGEIKRLTKKQIIQGLIVGSFLAAAYYVQTAGLLYTTPGKNAFLTAFYCAVVPFITWVMYKKKPDGYSFIAAFLCLLGIGFISLTGSMQIQIGDFLSVCSGVLFAFHMVFLERYSKGQHITTLITMQFICVAMFSMIVSLFTENTIALIQATPLSVYFEILYLVLFATVIAMSFQNIGQKITDPCKASLILSLESVFGVLFSVLLYGEILTVQTLIGFIIVFIAIVISETKLSFLKKG